MTAFGVHAGYRCYRLYNTVHALNKRTTVMNCKTGVRQAAPRPRRGTADFALTHKNGSLQSLVIQVISRYCIGV